MPPTWIPLLTTTQGKGWPLCLCLYKAEMVITLFTSFLQASRKGISIIPHTVLQSCHIPESQLLL